MPSMKKDKFYKLTEKTLKDYRNIIKRNEDDIQIKKLDIALRSLCDEEYRLFEYLYCYKCKSAYIIHKLNLSKSSYYDMRYKLILKISEAMYPIAIREVYDL